MHAQAVLEVSHGCSGVQHRLFARRCHSPWNENLASKGITQESLTTATGRGEIQVLITL